MSGKKKTGGKAGLAQAVQRTDWPILEEREAPRVLDGGESSEEAVGVGPCPACGSVACSWWRGNDPCDCSAAPIGWRVGVDGSLWWLTPEKYFGSISDKWILDGYVWWRSIGWMTRLSLRRNIRGEYEEASDVVFGPFASHEEAVAVSAAAHRMPFDRFTAALDELQERTRCVRHAMVQEAENGRRELLASFVRGSGRIATQAPYHRFRAIAERAMKDAGCTPGCGLVATPSDTGVTVTLTKGPFDNEADVLEALYDVSRHLL